MRYLFFLVIIAGTKNLLAQQPKLVLPIGHTRSITMASFSPDGKIIASSSVDKTAKIWDANTGSLLVTLKDHKDRVNSIYFSPSGNEILTASDDKTGKIWETKTGRLLRTLLGHSKAVNGAFFNSTGNRIITSSDDGTVKIWNSYNGKLLSTFPNSLYLKTPAFDLKQDKVAIALNPKTIGIWNLKTLKNEGILKGNDEIVRCAAFSLDGNKIATGSENGRILIWDTKSYEIIDEEWLFIGGAVETLAFDSAGKRLLYTTTFTDSLLVWNLENSKLEKLKGETSNVYSVGFSPDGKKIVTTTRHGLIKLWDAYSGKLLSNSLIFPGYERYGNYISTVRFSYDGSKIATTSEDGVIRIWDARNFTEPLELKGHTSNIFLGCVSQDFKKVSILSVDWTAKIWNIEYGTLLSSINGHANRIYDCLFNPTGDSIYTNSYDGTSKIWNTNTGRLVKEKKENLSVGWKNYSQINQKKNLKIISEDQVTKLVTLKTNSVICTFIIVDSSDFISIVPSGYYQSTQAAAKLLHYVTKDLKVITFEQLDLKYNRPDKVLIAIGNTDSALIRSYRQAWEKRIQKLGIDTSQFRDDFKIPEADIYNRNAVNYDQSSRDLRIDISAIDSSYNLDRFNIWINEVPVYGQRGINLRSQGKRSLDTTISITLSDSLNRIETSVTNVNGIESYRIPLLVNYTPPQKQIQKTYFVGIGIDEFSDTTHNLKYSVKDIRDLAEAMKERYKDIKIDTLFNGNVTLEKVRALKESLQHSGVNDKIIIAYSGHGLLSDSMDYYLSTHQVNFKKPEEGGLPYEELENLLDSIPARKKLMLIDACHSGEIDKEELLAIIKKADSLGLAMKKSDEPGKTNHTDEKKTGASKGGDTESTGENQLGLNNSFELMQSLFVNVGKSTGATIIAAAGGQQFALEGVNNLSNGVFTYSILQAMKEHQTLKISELKRIVGEKVEQLTDGLQKPTSRNETIAVDWKVW